MWKLHTRKYFQEKSCDYIHCVIYRPHLWRVIIISVSFQLISSQEVCKQYLLMSNHELRTRKVLNKHTEPWINVSKCSEKTLRHFENIRNIQTDFPRSGMRRVRIQSVEMFHFMELQSIFTFCYIFTASNWQGNF